MLETKGIFTAIIAFVLLSLGLYSKKETPILVFPNRLHKKRINIIYFGIFAAFWLFGACVTDSYDIGNYKWAYNDRVSHGKEPLFDTIQFFFHDAGWSFEAFKVVWVSIVFVLLYRGIKKYSRTPGAVAGLAVVTVMAGFITQMRSALVGAIFLNAFQLILSGKRKDRILYLIIILLSAQIHIIGYSFLIFLIANPKKHAKFKKMYYIIVALTIVIALFGSSFFVPIIYRMLNLLLIDGNGADRVLSYFQGESSQFRYAFFLTIKHLLLFFLADRACEVQLKVKDINYADTQKFQIIRESNALMLIFLPITIVSASFERLFNYFILIQYSMVFNVGKSKIVLFKKYLLNINLQSVLVLGILLMTFVEWYFSPGDLIKMLNSLEWVF